MAVEFLLCFIGLTVTSIILILKIKKYEQGGMECKNTFKSETNTISAITIVYGLSMLLRFTYDLYFYKLTLHYESVFKT